mgnify:CR=1 FL=1
MKYATNSTKKGAPMRLSFVDVKKAYFNAKPKRNLLMSFPKELGLPSNLEERQVRCVYGTRDARALWEDVHRHCLEDIGFRGGVVSPRCFYHAERDLCHPRGRLYLPGL